MTGLAHHVVVISAALLPARVRDRYREQWLGELRDAPALGVRPSEIAAGSLAFALTFARKMTSRRRPSTDAISRRARLSIALAASAVVLAFSQNASAPWNAQTGTDELSAAVGFLWTVLTIYVVVAPLAALLAVFATRGMSWRVRAAVVVLAATCALPIAPFIRTISTSPSQLVYLVLATIALPALGVFVATVALTVRRRAQALSSRVSARRAAQRMIPGLLAALVVAGFVGVGFGAASMLWDSRTRLHYGGPKPSAEFDQWLSIKTSVEHTVSVTLDLWLAIGLIFACAVVVMTSRRRATLRQTITLTVIALCAVVFSFGSLLSFLQFVLPSIASSLPIGLGTEVAEIGLVILLLVSVTGERRSAPDANGPDVAVSDRLDEIRVRRIERRL